MNLPPRAGEIIQALYEKHRDLAERDDDSRRDLMRIIAGQLSFELGAQYGVKAAGIGRPQGQSTIAYESHDGLGGWRILDGDGSVTGIINAPIPHPPYQAFDGQIFIPCAPMDWLGVRAAPAPVEPTSAPVVPVTVPPVVLTPAPAPGGLMAVPAPVPDLPAPAPVPSGFSALLTAAGAWAGQQLVALLLGWWAKRQTVPTSTPTSSGTAIPRPIPPSRSTLPR
jgi:hypothetical protein